MKIFSFDTETTGLPNKDYTKPQPAIHQIVAYVHIDGKLIDSINLKIKPFKGALIDDKALEIGNVTREQIESYEEESVQFGKLLFFMDKYVNKFSTSDFYIPLGHNIIQFDIPMLAALFRRNNNNFLNSYFGPNVIDTCIIAKGMILNVKKNKRGTENHKLKTLCLYKDIKWDDELAHEANYDTIQTMKLANKLLNLNLNI